MMEAIDPSKSLVEKTYDALVDAICAGVFRPGERLTQDEIAERLNVSRQPVNSAIAMLKTQRLVTDTGRRGVVVAPVSRELFEAIYQYRSAVEPLAVELATPRLDAEAIARGRAILAKGSELVRRDDDMKAMVQADMDFHTLIYETSGNPLILDGMRLNWLHLRRAMGEVLRYAGTTVRVWDEHHAIFEAMVAGDGSGAAASMRRHVVESAIRVMK